MSTTGTSDAPQQSTWTTKAGLAKMLKGGVIMDVVNAEQVGSCAPIIIDAICISTV
jgi:pyridoxal 5'-phosphate synthase pdxS subunit